MDVTEQSQPSNEASSLEHEQPLEQPAVEEIQQPDNQSAIVLEELTDQHWGSLGSLLPALEGCEQITADGGVLKHVLVQGAGEPPQKFARCLVHYIGRLQSNGSIFYDSKSESQTQQPVTVIAGRHTSPREEGLFKAVETMRVGERCTVYVQDPKYGYGATGSFSFPSVPPNEQLTYDVELVDYENAEGGEEDDNRTGLLFEERLERAEARRLDGNKLFSNGKYKEALAKYAVALSYLDEDFMMQLEGFYEDKANEVKFPIHLNMAACQIKTQDYHTAIHNCTEVIKLQPDHTKALYRRAVAKHALGQTEEAMTDLQKAQEKAPHDQAILKEIAAVRATLKQERDAQAKLFKGAFKAPEPSLTTHNKSEISSNQQTTQGGSRGMIQNQGAVARQGLFALLWTLLTGFLLRLFGINRKAVKH